MNGIPLEAALVWLGLGNKICRESWRKLYPKGTGFLIFSKAYLTTLPMSPYVFKFDGSDLTRWSPTIEDLTATDWILWEEPNI